MSGSREGEVAALAVASCVLDRRCCTTIERCPSSGVPPLGALRSTRCLVGIGLSDGALGSVEPNLRVGAITEWFAGGTTTATERNGRTINLIRRPVGVNHGHRTLHQIWPVLQWRDRDCIIGHTAWSTTFQEPLKPSEARPASRSSVCDIALSERCGLPCSEPTGATVGKHRTAGELRDSRATRYRP